MYSENQHISEWLSNRPKWLQMAAKHILEFTEINESTISELVELCRLETSNEFPNIDYSIPKDAFSSHDSEEIRLCSISEVSGVNKLAPQKPLNFGSSNITVIYGHNGSGKTGYVRLLKHICGVRDCIRDELHNNVFSSDDVPRNAKISFLKQYSPTEYQWSGQGLCDELCSVDIFDASFSRVFVGEENEVSYEPLLLSFFSQLIDICEEVGKNLDSEGEKLISKMPKIPDALINTTSSEWLKKLNDKISPEDIDQYCLFTVIDEKELQDLHERISEKSPADKAKQLQNRKFHADNIVRDIKGYIEKLSDEKCKQFIKTKKQSIIKKEVADAAAKKVFSNAQIEGIGSDTWKELWEAARKYSEEMVYPTQEFPVIQSNSVCVLCHQELTEDAQKRFSSFESYIRGETQKQADQAKHTLEQAINNLPNIPLITEFKTKFDAAGIEDQSIIDSLMHTINFLSDRKASLFTIQSESELSPIQSAQPVIDSIQIIAQEYEERAGKHLEDAKNENRDALKNKLNQLKAKKWLSEQKVAIQEEVNRLQLLNNIQEAKKKTNSTTLSKKKGELSEMLITAAFVDRFNSELNLLGASKLEVELIKSRVSKGKVLHTLKLRGADHNLQDVLSEGENRVVSIAAFLADVCGKNYPSPFVFDDPISSLDQDYEEAVVQRLCSLATERQVIIFTHRLSLLGMIQDYAKKANIEPEILCIREESWGTGEPGDTPLFAKKPDKALNQLMNDRLSKAIRLLKEHGREAYDPYVKSLCSDFRILLERMIECELMSGVVERYRRAINTMGKISNLAKISMEDCNYFDELMTKYSRYEHSQPIETPIRLPEPGELEKDFKELQQWLTEFKIRTPKPSSQES
ncbi:hypothetical protein O6D35_07940 [Legionella pneumophila]|uniref:AAA family ATPase n=1 Tax=Legionella pneumophila TaxID=446 RepID=UPI0022B3FEFE|nr:hypothetical protein [Legionella pneumophila]MCZ4703921.1 hypothetical protein [Legionella pneumophila]